MTVKSPLQPDSKSPEITPKSAELDSESPELSLKPLELDPVPQPNFGCFIRGIQRLNLQSTIAWHLQDGSALGRTLDDIERLAQELKSDTETAAPFPDIEGEPGFYAPFWIYPIAESLCALGWVQQRRAAERLGTSMSENVADLSKAAQSYMTAAKTYPLDEEERPFSLYMAFEILCRAKFPLRLSLPICRQIKDAMAAADVIWDGTRLSLETETKVANCRRAIAFLEDCEKKIAAGSLTLDDVVSPVFVRGL
uniref:Uncharacterized protein n=1 Tax=Mycena chlorophos TaxID=658473 RepID=A0ABQ0M8V8_MYCCL|nr:predicted protein [Mycena chlorophos]